jgi:flavodoxin
VACVEQASIPRNPSTPRVLLVYYTYRQQTKLVAEAIADVLRDRGCEVRPAAIGFTDKRWAERFRDSLCGMPTEILGMLPAQLRAATGEIQIPDEAREGNYDLVCIGSPTWLFAPNVPIR